MHDRSASRNTICALAACLVLAACQDGGARLADGTRVDLASSDWLVINYWAEWCGPCRHEIPELNDLAEQAGPLPVRVLGVNYDGLRDAKLLEAAARMDIRFPLLVEDPRARWEQPVPAVLPSTFVVAPGGRLVETLVGPQTRASVLARLEVHAAALAAE